MTPGKPEQAVAAKAARPILRGQAAGAFGATHDWLQNNQGLQTAGSHFAGSSANEPMYTLTSSAGPVTSYLASSVSGR